MLLTRRAELSAVLADTIRSRAETSARRREHWSQAFEYQLRDGANITTMRATADSACTHLDSELDRLGGDIEAMRVELSQIDAELTWGQP